MKMKTKQRGQGLAEYAIIILLVALAVVLGITLMGEKTRDTYSEVAEALGGDGVNANFCESDMTSAGDWSFAGNGTGSWSLADGQMCRVTDNQNGYAYSTCSQTEAMKDPSDYTIHLEDVVLKRGQGYGVMFRLQDYDSSPNGYAFQYDPGLDGLVFRKWVNGWEVWNPLDYQQLVNYEYYLVPRDIDIVVKGNTMAAYIDGELVLSASDDTYDAGGVGLRTWGSTEVCFDDFAITAIP